MATYKCGVIGAGAIACACHVPGYANADNCELTAVADPRGESFAELARNGWEFANTYADWREMLNAEHLDVVSICTPNKLHADQAVECLNRGLTVLLEKPIALTMDDAGRIAAALDAGDGKLMTGFTHRFNELNVAARAAVAAGKIGRPYMARIRFAHTGPIPGWARTDWFHDPDLAGGGALLDMGIHAFDLIQWYVGPATGIQAAVGTLRKDIPLDDNAVAVLTFADGAMGYVEAGWTSPVGFCGVEIMGDDGAIFVDYAKAAATMVHGVTKPDGTTMQETVTLAEGPTRNPWAAEMEHFIANLDSGAFDVGIDEGVSSLRLALGAYESSRTGRRVEIEA